MASIADLTKITGDRTILVGNTTVYYSRETDGSGSLIGPDFVSTIKYRNPGVVFDNCLEWCAGPGFIGFNLLEAGVCNTVTFIECANTPIGELQKTLDDPSNSHLNGKVTVLQTDRISGLLGKYDLVVGNPPFNNGDYEFSNIFGNAIVNTLNGYLETKRELGYPKNFFKNFDEIYPRSNHIDDDFAIHEEFFSNIKNNLNSNAVIYLIEGTLASNANTFSSFIENGDLRVTATLPTSEIIPNPYYDEIVNIIGQEYPPIANTSFVYYLEIKSA